MLAAAKARDLPTDVLQRMLLFMNPRVGQSVDRIYELTKLYHETTVAAARRLVAILREADKDEVFRDYHQAVGWAGAAENTARGLSELSRRPTNWREQRLRGVR